MLDHKCVNAALSGPNVSLNRNGCLRVARSLTGYITDQFFVPGVSTRSQADQQRHTHTRSHRVPQGLIGSIWNTTVGSVNFWDYWIAVTNLSFTTTSTWWTPVHRKHIIKSLGVQEYILFLTQWNIQSYTSISIYRYGCVEYMSSYTVCIYCSYFLVIEKYSIE